MRKALYVIPLAVLLGCSSSSDSESSDPTSGGFAPTSADGPNKPTTPGQGNPITIPPLPDANLQEVVNVIIDGGGLCTGTAISKTMVVTAAHCLDRSSFQTWDVVAPLAPGQPSRHGSRVQQLDGDFENVAKPDIGVIILDEPLDLPAYAELFDITSRVEGGGKVMSVTMVRKYIDTEAPLKLISDLEASSDVPNGYEHGIVTRFFSEGGDSGAGLFLVENGRRTHKLIGVARQPEPDVDLDHFTRIDSTFIAWVKTLKQ